MKTIRFAFALNFQDEFEPAHFGDAESFHIYKSSGEDFQLISKITNPFKDSDEEKEHGSKSKGMAIIELLKEQQVEVLVSMQFGRNIKLINTHFIPAITSEPSQEKTKKGLLKNYKWFCEDLERKPEHYKLFDLRHGNLKIQIK